MNIVISDPKKGKAYNKNVEEPAFIGKKIGETISLNSIGLKGYKAVITGGSDQDGFPMKKTLEGTRRRKLLMKKGIGMKPKQKGEKRRKTVRGNTVSKDTHQLNLKIAKHGSKKLSEMFTKPGKETKKTEKKEKSKETGEKKKEQKEKKEKKQKRKSEEKKESKKEKTKKKKKKNQKKRKQRKKKPKRRKKSKKKKKKEGKGEKK